MTEKEFVALLAIEGRKLCIDRQRFRVKTLEARLHYMATVLVPYPTNGDIVYEEDYRTDWYRSRAYAVQKLIKTYYDAK